MFEDQTAARGLARAVDELDPELIVVGSTRRGAAGSALLGTTAERLIHSSSCPVAVIPNGYETPEGGVRLIGAAYSSSDEGREALHAAASLARAGGAKLRAITVLDPDHASEGEGRMAEQHDELSPSVDEAARGRLGREQELRDAVAALGDGLDVEVDILVNEPADGLVAASEQVDLLVMGSRGLGPKRAVVLGSVSRKVVDRAACPVLVLPRGASAKTEALLADAEAQAGHARLKDPFLLREHLLLVEDAGRPQLSQSLELLEPRILGRRRVLRDLGVTTARHRSGGRLRRP